MIADANGKLHGTTEAGGAYGTIQAFNIYTGGTVFELAPPASVGGSWTESVLWNFGNGSDGLNPFAGVIADANGNLFGATSAGGAYPEIAHGALSGTVFEVSTLSGPQITVKPPLVQFPATAIGSTSTINLVVTNSVMHNGVFGFVPAASAQYSADWQFQGG